MGIAGLDDDRLLDGLKKGGQVAFDAGPAFAGKLLLEADPSAKQLVARDEKGERVAIAELLERKRGYESGLDKQSGKSREVLVRPKMTRARGKGLGH